MKFLVKVVKDIIDKTSKRCKKMSKIKKITCGKFDQCININFNPRINSRKVIRIGSKNPNSLKLPTFEPISTDGKAILYQNKLYGIRDFLANTDKTILNNLILLTIKERDLILEELVDFNLDINVFEVKYPIFNHIKYISNLYKNYEELEKLLHQVTTLNIKGKSLAHGLSTDYLFKIERKLRFKNELDYFFAFAYKGGYSEVFKLKEERKDRTILSFDFNSMYVDGMMGEFLEPKSIKYVKYEGKFDTEDLVNGLYRVIFKNVNNTFFKEFHPFKYMKLNHSFYFNLEDNQHIELLLFKNEIDYYKKFFNGIEILEGFCSKSTIKHPLKEYAKKIYEDRLQYKEEENQLMNDYCKYRLISIHSATNSKRFKTIYFDTKENMIKFLELEYMISFPENLNTDERLASIEDKNYFSFKKYKKGYKVKARNFNTHESIYSLSAQIVANSRVKMVQTIEKFLLHESVEICYTNIDSLHISILKSEVDNFLLTHKNMISTKLGHLKIESRSEKGYWFDVGRYWLISDGRVDIFKNSFFNHKANKTEFVKNRKLKFIYRSKIFSYVKVAYTNIYRMFTYPKSIVEDKSLDNFNYKRYSFKEIENLDVAMDTYSKEALRSKKLKVDLYNKIATV